MPLRSQGFGLAFLMAFSAIILTTMVSAALVGNQTNAVLMGDQVTQSAATSLAVAAMPLVKADIQTKLNAGTSVTTSYTKTGTITIPQSPTNLSGSTSNSGTYSASVLGVRGNFYLINVQGKATDHYGNTIISSQNSLLEIKGVPLLTCSQVESAILAGNISTVSSASLISYAQNSCYSTSHTAPAWVASTFPLTLGTGSNCTGCTSTYSSSGTYNGKNITSGATVTFNGTYTLVKLNTLSNSGITSTNASGLTRTMVSASNTGMTVGLSGSGTQFFETGSITSGSTISTGTGSATILANGSSALYNSGITFGSAANSAYLNGILGGTADFSSSTSGTLYFDSLTSGSTITGSPGNDTIACVGTYNAGCGSVSNSGISAGDGNDTLIVNSSVVGTTVDGQNGFNIVQVNGCTSGSTVNATNTGNSLLVVSGNQSNSGLQASGANNVVLIKTGTTSTGMTVSGFARTLYY